MLVSDPRSWPEHMFEDHDGYPTVRLAGLGLPDLAPCPHCGLRNAAVRRTHYTPVDMPEWSWVHCYSCEAQGPSAFMPYDAVMRWNARIAPRAGWPTPNRGWEGEYPPQGEG